MKKILAFLLALSLISNQAFASFVPSNVKAEDSASAGADNLTPVGGIREDAPSTTTSTDGDYTPAKFDSAGRQWVNASGAAIPVTDNSGSLTVDGSVTANAGTNLNTSALSLETTQGSVKTAVEKIDDFISGSRGLVTEDNSAAIKTSTELIDDSIVADDAAFTPATTKVQMGGFEYDDTSPDSVDEGDAGSARMSARREVYTQIRDAAGNERGLNIDASNRLAATVTNATAANLLAQVNVASGGIASGALASGSVASGAVASGAIASGAIAAGAIANGATSIAENEDVASADADRGVKVWQIRDDTLDARSGTEGDYEPFHANANGATWMIDVNSAAALTSTQLIDDTIVADDAAFTPATTKVNMAGYEFDDTSPDSVDEGDSGAARMSGRREVYMQLRDAAGNERGLNIDASNRLAATVTNATAANLLAQVSVASGGIASGALASGSVASGAVASGAIASGAIASGAIAAGAIANGATAIAENEDVASADADRGVKMLAVRKATAANTSGTDGDYEFLQMSAGRLWASTNIDQINGVTPLMGSGASGTGALRVEIANNGTGLVTTNPATAANWGIYVEDAAETAAGNLSMSGSVRRDTQASSAGTSGDNATINTDSTGDLWITGTYIEDAAETAAGQLLMAGSVRRDTAASSSGTSGDNSTINTDALGKLWTTGSYAEDAGHTTADTLVAVATRRIDTPASSAGTSADYATLDSSAEGAVYTTPIPTTGGGATTHALASAASTNSTSVKNGVGNVYLLQAVNTTGTVYYWRLYNSATAPTCSSATGFVESIPIPASTTGAGIVIPESVPQNFATGIGYCITGSGTSTDNTSAVVGLYVKMLYK